jgi:alkanesulfonate monooxygenase SsuD/methylene tetrahydromethanopterin reductase-like flavin-dependent oxidoreductase (luciferase family)
LGVGAAWLAHDYEALGFKFGDPGYRAARFEETLEIISDLLDGTSAHYDGEHYQVKD